MTADLLAILTARDALITRLVQGLATARGLTTAELEAHYTDTTEETR